MREIKFRGMDIHGNWHYGLVSILKVDTRAAKKGYYISNKVGMPLAIDIRPETATQYINLKDKNGTEIYEGDVVEGTTYKEPIMTRTAKRCRGIVRITPESPIWASWEIPDGFRTYPNLSDKDIEVIGNIYENPELLEQP